MLKRSWELTRVATVQYTYIFHRQICGQYVIDVNDHMSYYSLKLKGKYTVKTYM